jgi:hypothetical protein
MLRARLVGNSMIVCRRISNRESARRLRKQRNEKLNSLLSQQDNLQGINDCLKAQITAAREELLRLTDENRGMLLQLGETVCAILWPVVSGASLSIGRKICMRRS